MSDTSTAASAAPVNATSEAPVEGAIEAAEGEEGEAPIVAEVPKVSNKRKYTPKVNGRQMEIELDFDNQDEVNKYLAKALGADAKFQEAASLRKNVEMLVNELKSNPRAVLSHPDLGVDLKKFATDILNEEIEELQKTPEQKELEKLRKELDGKTKREQQLEEEKRTAEMERLQEQAFKQFDDDLTSALEKSTLPKSPYTIKRVADILIEATNLGYDVNVHDVMPIVEQQINAELQKMFEVMPEEVMEKIIGSKNLSRMRKKRLATMKNPIETAKQVKETGKVAEKDKSKELPKKFGDLFGKF